MKRIVKTLLTVLVLAALLTAGVIYGPRLYRLLSGRANAQWISERFSQELVEKRELVVLTNTTTGQESVSTDAWLIGTVQNVVIPYTYSVSFTVDLQQAVVGFDTDSGAVQVTLPLPVAAYDKLTVDEDSVQKHDLLYPLTTDRYTQIKQELEEKLYTEAVADPQLRQSAWEAAVNQTEAMYQALLDANETTAAMAIQVIAGDAETAVE